MKKGKEGLGLFKPTIRKHSLDITANVTASKKIFCTFFGNPIPTVTWKHNITNTTVYNQVDYDASEMTSILLLNNLTWEDRGYVRCESSSILRV